MIRKFLLLLSVTAASLTAFAQKSYNEQVTEYITRFKDLAMQEQQRTGIPASITLAQGIFETAAGNSELCTNASNHFGIKCKNTWTGDTYTYTDDAKDECFRKYPSATHSYRDHSDFLKTNQRYSSLFLLSPTDYASWAYGLKRCGYATNPQYAKKLIKFIEDYKLQEYTYAALGNTQDGEILLASAQSKAIPRSKTVATVVPGENIPVNDAYIATNPGLTAATEEEEEQIFAEKATQQEQRSAGSVTDYYLTTTKNGMKGFYAKKGDMLLEYAIKNKIRYAKLLEMNDLPDEPLEADMFIYLSKKAKAGQAFTHTVEDGESLLQISQDEGIQLQQLRSFNHLEKEDQPLPGSVLNLQAMAADAPKTYSSAAAAKKAATSKAAGTIYNNEGYVTAGKKSDAPRQVVLDDIEEVKTEAGPVATNSGSINIANEKPVEETIAQEKAQAKISKKEESKMSALDKLKAHMDKTVYADNQTYEPKASGHYDENVVSAEEEVVTTTPARRNVVSARETKTEERKQPKAAEKREKDNKSKKKEILKAKAKTKNHTVKKGETLFDIAEKYDLTVTQLQKINKLNSKKIQAGMKLKIVK